MTEMLKVITTGLCADCAYPGTARCQSCQGHNRWAKKPDPLFVQLCPACSAVPGELHEDGCTITSRMSAAKDANKPFDPNGMAEPLGSLVQKNPIMG